MTAATKIDHCRRVGYMYAVLLFVSSFTTHARAVDPLRTAVVVNGNSVDSLTVANHYVSLRAIPDLQAIVLDDVPEKPTCDVDAFRNRILGPLLEELDSRGLGGQTDLIAYSAGFPTAINLHSDLKQIPDRHKVFTPVGSLNGLTHLYLWVINNNPHYLSPRSNHYARSGAAHLRANPFVGPDREAYDNALAAGREKRFDDGLAALDRLITRHPEQWPLRYRRLTQLVQAGKHDEAFVELERLAEQGYGFNSWLESNRELDPIKEDERYRKLVEAMPEAPVERLPAVPFSARRAYGVNGLPVGDLNEGFRGLLSLCLAVTHGRGTSLKEAVEILQRAASADGSGSPSQFYFSNSSDVRATTRRPLVPDAAAALRELGHEVIITRDRLPNRLPRLMGVMLGSANFEWVLARSKILPGGIAENLTSTGGVLHALNSQTAMTELLLAGAAGTSGTVTEPYALPFKFPTPMLYPYYAQGYTLAEAFYLSVESPYQLLIVGDPLCRPFGDEHTEAFSLEVVESRGDAIQIAVKFWRGRGNAEKKIDRLEIFVDGKLVGLSKVVDRIRIAKSDLPPGDRLLTITAISRRPPEMRSSASIVMTANPFEPSPELTASLQDDGEGERGIKISLTAPGASRLAVRHLGRRIIEFAAEEQVPVLSVNQVGYGPVRLIPEALVGDSWTQGKEVVVDVPIR